jgi:hypothetical protein
LFLIYEMMFLINEQFQTTKYDALVFVRVTMLVILTTRVAVQSIESSCFGYNRADNHDVSRVTFFLSLFYMMIQI